MNAVASTSCNCSPGSGKFANMNPAFPQMYFCRVFNIQKFVHLLYLSGRICPSHSSVRGKAVCIITYQHCVWDGDQCTLTCQTFRKHTRIPLCDF